MPPVSSDGSNFPEAAFPTVPDTESRSCRRLSSPAPWTTGTMSPRGVCAARPRLMSPWVTISPAAVSIDELMIGYFFRPATTKRATSESSEYFSPVRASSAFFVASSSVASTSSQIVASGISCRDFVRRSDTTLRSPVIGVRVSRSLWSELAAGEDAFAGDVPAGTWAAAPAPDSIAAMTSALVTTPPGPVPGRLLALMP